MSAPDMTRGMSGALLEYLTTERERNRKLEDEELDYRRTMIEGMLARPDFNPAYMGKALHDLMEIGQQKTGQRKSKGGMDRFTGAHELPLSQFLSGVMSGSTPIMEPPAPPVPTEAAGIAGPEMVNQPQYKAPNIPGVGDFSGEQVLAEPIAIPPKGSFVPGTAKRLAGAAQDMQAYNNRPPSVFQSPNAMAEQKAHAAVAGKNIEVEGTLGRIKKYVSDPADQEAAIDQALGVPNQTAFLGTTVKNYTDPADPGGQPFPGIPLKTGGIYNQATKRVVPGAQLVDTSSANRLSSLYQMAARYLGLSLNAADWQPQDAQRMQQFLLSNDGQKLVQQLGMQNEFMLHRAWETPRIMQGVNAAGQNVQGFMTPSGQSGGGNPVSFAPLVPMPPLGGGPDLTPDFSNPPVSGTPGSMPDMQHGPTATRQTQKPIIRPQAAAAQTGAGPVPPPPAKGQGGFARDANGMMLTATPTGQQTDIQSNATAFGLLKQIQTEYTSNPQVYNEYLGPYSPWVQTGKYYMPFMDQDAPYAKLAPLVGEYRNRMLKALSGAQVVAQEAQRLEQSIPAMSDEPAMFLNKLNTQAQVIGEIAQAYIARGRPVPPELAEAAAGLGVKLDLGLAKPPGQGAQQQRRQIPGTNQWAKFVNGKWIVE